MKLVARYFELRLEHLRSPDRAAVYSHPRAIAMYLCRRHTECSFPLIGQAFGGRNHSTVYYAVEKIRHRIKEDPETREAVQDLTKKIEEMS